MSERIYGCCDGKMGSVAGKVRLFGDLEMINGEEEKPKKCHEFFSETVIKKDSKAKRI